MNSEDFINDITNISSDGYGYFNGDWISSLIKEKIAVN